MDNLVLLHKKVKLKYFSKSHGKERWYEGEPKTATLTKGLSKEQMMDIVKQLQAKAPFVLVGDEKLTILDFKPRFSYEEKDAAHLSKKEVDGVLAMLYFFGYGGFSQVPVVVADLVGDANT